MLVFREDAFNLRVIRFFVFQIIQKCAFNHIAHASILLARNKLNAVLDGCFNPNRKLSRLNHTHNNTTNLKMVKVD